MKKIVTFALATGGALALAACGGAKTEEAAPAAEATPAEMMAPAEEPAAPAATAESELDPTGNPIGPDTTSEAAGATPAAE